jgi:hypothetical protein
MCSDAVQPMLSFSLVAFIGLAALRRERGGWGALRLPGWVARLPLTGDARSAGPNWAF